LYELSRIDVLLSHGFLNLPPNLEDVVTFVDQGDLLTEYMPEDRDRILAELREGAS
jgi:hypothetical protein